MATYPIFFRATGWKVLFFFQIKNELVSKHEILLKRAALQESLFSFFSYFVLGKDGKKVGRADGAESADAALGVLGAKLARAHGAAINLLPPVLPLPRILPPARFFWTG